MPRNNQSSRRKKSLGGLAAVGDFNERPGGEDTLHTSILTEMPKPLAKVEPRPTSKADEPTKPQSEAPNAKPDKINDKSVQLWIPKSKHKALKRYALEEEIMLKDILMTAVDEYMAKNGIAT